MIRAIVFSLLSAAFLTTTTNARAEGPATSTAPTVPVTRFTVSPAALVKPDLAYELLPPPHETQPGNAATAYYSAMQALVKPKTPGGGVDGLADYVNTVDHLRSCPLEEMGEQVAQHLLVINRTAMEQVRRAARYESIDWQTDLRQRGYNASLDYLQDMRSLANLVQVQARLAIRRHEWPAAQEAMQTGYAMARHLGSSQTVLEAMVGREVAEKMNACVQEWVTQPGSPNLYWPLSALPSPMIDLRHALAFERDTVAFSFPQWSAMRAGACTPEQWTDYVTRFMLVRSDSPQGASPAYQRELTAVGLAVLEYPRAKQFLIDRGQANEQVNTMSVSAALGEFTVRGYEESADNLYKWMALPPPQIVEGFSETDKQFELDQHPTSVLAVSLLPSLARAAMLIGKVDRHVAMLRIIEACRAYAAEHHALPDSLDQLSFPVPQDPLHNATFSYERTETGAVLSASGRFATEAARYEIVLRK